MDSVKNGGTVLFHKRKHFAGADPGIFKRRGTCSYGKILNCFFVHQFVHLQISK